MNGEKGRLAPTVIGRGKILGHGARLMQQRLSAMTAALPPMPGASKSRQVLRRERMLKAKAAERVAARAIIAGRRKKAGRPVPATMPGVQPIDYRR